MNLVTNCVERPLAVYGRFVGCVIEKSEQIYKLIEKHRKRGRANWTRRLSFFWTTVTFLVSMCDFTNMRTRLFQTFIGKAKTSQSGMAESFLTPICRIFRHVALHCSFGTDVEGHDEIWWVGDTGAGHLDL